MKKRYTTILSMIITILPLITVALLSNDTMFYTESLIKKHFIPQKKYTASSLSTLIPELLPGFWDDGVTVYTFHNNGSLTIEYIEDYTVNDPNNTYQKVNGKWKLVNTTLTISINNSEYKTEILNFHYKPPYNKYSNGTLSMNTSKPLPLSEIGNASYDDFDEWLYGKYFRDGTQINSVK